MARYDVVDEATFHAPPAVVWKALLREFGGETSWWLPDLEFRPLGDGFSGEIGDEVEVTPHPRGGRPSPIGLAFVGSVRELDAPTGWPSTTCAARSSAEASGSWTRPAR